MLLTVALGPAIPAPEMQTVAEGSHGDARAVADRAGLLFDVVHRRLLHTQRASIAGMFSGTSESWCATETPV
jgi:hypothetical protein